ncbi:MAG: 16S rRNA (guanine(966)-N(2))-methyltransferase RsmD [Acidobacteriota bacterium]|nr:16S rRNA (guanine(966)-N(2))-methyltransferase RsmD [Acidobacteriota bacterium]
MRVIAGEFRSRRLLSTPGMETRPTSDRLRETLFDILGTSVEGAVFVDAYAGTGAVGIEALSRGARRAIFIEKDRKAVETIRKNLENLGITERAAVIQGSAHLYLGGIESDIVFLDPPYLKEKEYPASLEALNARSPLLAIVQHAARLRLEDNYGPLHRTRVVKQGDNALSFYRIDPA